MIYKVIGRETIASIASAVGFTSTFIPNTNNKTIYAIVQSVGGDCRFCIDGTDPTGALGLRLKEDDSIEVWGSEALQKFRAINDTGTSTLEVVYMGGA